MDSYSLFEILAREHSTMLAAYIRSMVQDPGSIDDIWQETMIVAWNRLDEFDRSRPFGPWLRGIAGRLILANRRSSCKTLLLENAEAVERLEQNFARLQPLQGDTLDEKLDALRDCVQRLSEADQECIQLRFHEDLKPADMSQRLGLALENVKKRLYRAKRQLLTCLEKKLQASEAAS